MQGNNLNYYRREFKAMGTPCEIQLFVRNEAKARHAADSAIADVQRLEALYSRYKIDSFLYEGALASSGDYERCMMVNGIRYGHVLNPKTGWPVRHLAAVSVVGDFCLVAGSASTIAMLKEDQETGWFQDLGLPHLWVDVHGETGGSIAITCKWFLPPL